MDAHEQFMKDWFAEPLPFTTEKKKAYQGLEPDDGISKVILIDMDIIAYRAAAPCEGVFYTHPNLPDTYKYSSEIKKACAEEEEDPLLIDKGNDVEPEAFAIYNVDKMMERLLDTYDDEDIFVRGFLTGSVNFRHELNPEYKKSRKGSSRPTHLNACKQHLVNRYKAELEEGYEADDAMGWNAIMYRELDRPYVIATIDKDLNGIPGPHFNFVKNEQYDVSNLEAIKFFYMQCMMGDKTDDIPGIKGLGPKTAAKLLKEVDDPKTMYTIGLQQWRKFLFSDVPYSERLTEEQKKEVVFTYQASAELLWILREKGVMWCAPFDAMLPTEEA